MSSDSVFDISICSFELYMNYIYSICAVLSLNAKLFMHSSRVFIIIVMVDDTLTV